MVMLGVLVWTATAQAEEPPASPGAPGAPPAAAATGPTDATAAATVGWSLGAVQVQRFSGENTQIEEVITREAPRLGRLTACFAVSAAPPALGTLAVALNVDPSGIVASARVKSGQLQDAAQVACAEREALTWTLPASDGGGYRVRFPVQLVAVTPATR